MGGVFFGRYIKITEKSVPTPLMSSKGGHKVGTRHKVAGSRNHHKFLYRTLVYSSGREAEIMFFLDAEKREKYVFNAVSQLTRVLLVAWERTVFYQIA